MRRVMIVVPYKARDLHGSVLVGMELSERYGYEVEYTNGYGLERKILSVAPDLVVFDHLAWSFKIDQARLAQRVGISVAVLPTEGLVATPEAVRDLAGMKHGEAAVYERYLCWGPFHRDALLPTVDDPWRTPVVGCPRFDFYSGHLRSLLPPKASVAERLGFSDPDAPMVLWATNTPYATMDRRKVLGRYVAKARWSAAAITDVHADQVEQHRVHSQIMLDVAARFPAWNFVVKVHPAESVHPYLERFEHRPNVRVAYDAPIGDFLAACDALVHRRCTTATEAWMLEKPVVELHAGEYRTPLMPDVTRGCHIAADGRALEKALAAVIQDPQVDGAMAAARQEFIDRFYAGGDGVAAERAASALQELIAPDRLTDEQHERMRQRAAEELRDITAAAQVRLPSRIKRWARIDEGRSLRFWQHLTPRSRRDRRIGFVAEPEITTAMVAEVRTRIRAAASAEGGRPRHEHNTVGEGHHGMAG